MIEGAQVTEESPPSLSASDLADACEEAAFCFLQRGCAIAAPNVELVQLARDDEALAAYLDMLTQAGAAGWDVVLRSLDDASAAELFVAAAIACRRGADDWNVVRHLAASSSELEDALVSALAWSGASAAAPYIERLANEADPSGRRVGVAALGELRCDNAPLLASSLASSSPRLVGRCLQAAGNLGRTDLAGMALSRLAAQSGDLRWQAARAAVLLGDRSAATDVLRDMAATKASFSDDALRLLLLTSEPADGHAVLRACRAEHAVRARVQGAGIIGDVKYVPWLIDRMSEPTLARIAAEAFVHITGADFNLDQLESMPPEDFEDGPNDDPDDDDVELPEDIALPWPDVARLEAWWMEHRGEFTPGRKLFLGKPITPEHCIHVLKTGYQRQRVIAAHYRCLIQPGTVLFPTSAPAWRQQRLLAAL